MTNPFNVPLSDFVQVESAKYRSAKSGEVVVGVTRITFPDKAYGQAFSNTVRSRLVPSESAPQFCASTQQWTAPRSMFGTLNLLLIELFPKNVSYARLVVIPPTKHSVATQTLREEDHIASFCRQQRLLFEALCMEEALERFKAHAREVNNRYIMDPTNPDVRPILQRRSSARKYR